MSNDSTIRCARDWDSLYAKLSPFPNATGCMMHACNCSCIATISVVRDRPLSHYREIMSALSQAALLGTQDRAKESTVADQIRAERQQLEAQFPGHALRKANQQSAS